MAKLALRGAKGTKGTRAKGTGGKKSKAKAARRGGSRGGGARGGVPFSGQFGGSANSDTPF